MTQAHERTATLSQLVGKRIKLKLFLAEMSGRDLAAKLGVSASWVSYRLSGKQEIGVDDLLRIADVLGVGVHDLLPTPEEVATATRGGDRDLKEGYGRLGRSADVTAARHVSPRPFGQSARSDSSRPVSAIPASRRRPQVVRSSTRPMPH